MTLYRGPGGTGSATSDADTTLYQEFLNQTQAARDAALQAETNAELAETNAETAATAAASSASAAASNASSASSSASAASTSASNASTSASNAASSASAASASQSAAATSATNAASSASSAAGSATTATTQATNASNSATAAAGSASAASTSATNAASSASAAGTSATSAASSASAASASATSAATSASNAATSATNAANSATAAAASAASIDPATIVRLTGDQTIAGIKTFSSNPVINAGTSNQVQFLNASKALAGSANMTFNGTTLTVADLTNSSLTAGRIVYAGTGGNLVNSAALTFNGTNFATTGSVTSAGASNSGNLAFTGTGNRITGDFSNATLANRVMFQSNTVNGATSVGVLPNGTSTITNLNLFGGTDPANSSIGQFVNTGVDIRINANITGTGTYLPMAFYTGGSESFRCGTDGTLTVSKAAGLGYGTGSGGTVTQATSKSTAVTLNKPTGQITLNGSALAAGAEAVFVLNNTIVTAVDAVVVQSSNGNYLVRAYGSSAGTVNIGVKNNTGGSLSETPVLYFYVIKGAIA